MKRLSGALLTLLLALFLLPAVVLTLLSFLPSQTAQAIFQQEPAALSGLRLSTEQFVRALSDREYGRQFYNSAMLTGVSLALFFAFVGTAMKKDDVLGFTTLLIAHITFNLP